MDKIFGCAAGIAFVLFGIFQIYAAYLGLTDALGFGWGAAAIVIGLFAQTSIPIVIGAFLCAKNIWGWHWGFAALFAAPGLALIIPAITADFLDGARRRFR